MDSDSESDDEGLESCKLFLLGYFSNVESKLNALLKEKVESGLNAHTPAVQSKNELHKLIHGLKGKQFGL